MQLKKKIRVIPLCTSYDRTVYFPTFFYNRCKYCLFVEIILYLIYFCTCWQMLTNWISVSAVVLTVVFNLTVNESSSRPGHMFNTFPWWSRPVKCNSLCENSTYCVTSPLKITKWVIRCLFNPSKTKTAWVKMFNDKNTKPASPLT